MECLSCRRERGAPGGRARENRKFIQAPSLEMWSETISGSEEGPGGGSGGPVFGLPPWKKYRRRDRDHIVPDRKDGWSSLLWRGVVYFVLEGGPWLHFVTVL